MENNVLSSEKVIKESIQSKSSNHKSSVNNKIKETILHKVNKVKNFDNNISQEAYFTGIYIKHGRLKRELRDRTVLLVDIRNEEDVYLTDHVWLMNNYGFENLDLKKGDLVQFKATLVPSSKKVFIDKKEVGAYMHYDFKNIHSVRLVHDKEFMINK